MKQQLSQGELPGALDSSVDERTLYNIAYIVHRFDCDPEWVDSFLASMQMDVDKKQYNSIDDTIEYMYGSAEVIGLFMVKILSLPGQGNSNDSPEPDVLRFARYQGRAMQYINFLRDIAEDNELGRLYFPKDVLAKHGLEDLSKKTVIANEQAFTAFMHEQLDQYEQWQAEANKGMSYMPKRLRIPVQTAVDMYTWTAHQIHQDPLAIYKTQIKPKKARVATTAIKRLAL